MELTKKQNKAFEILARGIKRKYPFIKGIVVDENDKPDLVLFVKLIIDYDKFFEYAKEEPKESKLWDRESLKSFYNRFNFATVLPLIDNENYGIKFTEKISNDLDIIYKALPEDYQIKFKPEWSNNFYTVKIVSIELKIYVE